MRQHLLTDYFLSKNQQIQDERNQSQEPQFTPRFYVGQQFFYKHNQCNSNCQTFMKIKCCESPDFQQIPILEPLHLDECATFLKDLLNNKNELKAQRKVKKIAKKMIHKTKSRAEPLNLEQREKIMKLAEDGFKNGVIASVIGVTVGQVRMNRIMLSREKCKTELRLSQEEKQWIKNESSQSSNSSLFSAQLLLEKFHNHFASDKYNLYQFRKLLRQQGIRYKIPSLKPLTYFQKNNKNQEVHNFIRNITPYFKEEYKLIFIDESSLGSISRGFHRQWIMEGTFKQKIERIGANNCLIAGMGQDNFLFYQIIAETGKGFIFKQFLQNLILKAELHYKKAPFILIFDNATIHKSDEMKLYLQGIPHIFTPPYRPDMNGIEYLFAWIKRYVVKQQPLLTTKLFHSLHQGFAALNSDLVTEWCFSILKPMVQEISYLL